MSAVPGGQIRWISMIIIIFGFCDATRFYHRVKETVDHATAVTRCADLGLTLAILESATSWESMKSVVPAEAWAEYWIGLDYLSGSFGWADKSPFTWTQWEVSNEPNLLASEQCVVTNTDGGYRWYTRSCSDKYYFVCSVDLVGEYFTEIFRKAPPNDPVTSFPVVNRMHCVASCRRDPDCYFVTVEVSDGVSTCGKYNFNTFLAGLSPSPRDSWIPVDP
ncbi:uncharacterized protein LOC124140285 [Haliotis rufescens]|uniref:uncharacterized protein LOC124140285 n=1 Tax=Haliotis rufescens TaxID=6454 RepID=UPI00201EF8FA|nr:uncharacterized protein LOC124140285 [Haliotis rufescens]